jgi:hypothetical protein
MSGAMGGLGGLFGRGPKMSPQAMAELAEVSAGGDLASLTGVGGGPGALDGGSFATSGAQGGSRSGSKAKGKGGKKGKGGGRVTPKAR